MAVLYLPDGRAPLTVRCTCNRHADEAYVLPALRLSNWRQFSPLRCLLRQLLHHSGTVRHTATAFRAVLTTLFLGDDL